MQPDVQPPGADGPPDSDLVRPLQHIGQHDVHDADAADEQRDTGDTAHYDIEDFLRLLVLAEKLLRHYKAEIGLSIVQLFQELGHYQGR